jgi:hypothetical protein
MRVAVEPSTPAVMLDQSYDVACNIHFLAGH